MDRGHPVVDVAKRLGIPDNVLYTWVSKFKKADQNHQFTPFNNQTHFIKKQTIARELCDKIESTAANSEYFHLR
jgi:transposase-like protein